MKETIIILLFLLVVPLTAAADNEAKALYETKGDSQSIKNRFSKLNDQRISEWEVFQKRSVETIKEGNEKMETMHKRAASETVKGVKKANEGTVEYAGKINNWLREQSHKFSAYFSGHQEKH